MLAEVEAVLNSRPIAPLTPDPNDGEGLTPAHLFIGAGLCSLPHELEERENVKGMTSWKRWRLISALKRTFWPAWFKDYILGFQGKTKWQAAKLSLKTGDLLIIHEDNLSSQQWLLGRIVTIIVGRDGHVRVAEVLARGSVFKRRIGKLALLPMDG